MTDLFFNVVGWAGSALLVVSILQTRIDRLRWLNLVACGILVVYNLWLGSWPMVAMNAALVAINLLNLARLRKQSDGAGNEELSPTSSGAPPTVQTSE